jgi:hypothetical protein
VVDNFLYFDGFGLLDDDGVAEVDFLNDGILYFLDDGFLNELLRDDNSFMDDWYFYYFLYLSGDFLDDFDGDLDFLDDLLDGLLDYYLLLYPNHFFEFLDNLLHDHHLLDYLWYFDHSLDYLDDGDRFLDDAVDYLVAHFDVVVDLFGCDHLDLRYNFFDYFLYFNYFGYFNYLFDNLFNDNGDLFDDLYKFFGGDDLLDDDLHWLDFGLYVVDDPLELHYLLHFHLFLLYAVNYLQFRDLFDDLYDLLHNLGDLYNFLDDALNGHKFLNGVGDDGGDFQGDVNDFFDLFDSFDFYNSFDHFLNGDYLWDLNNPIHNLLHNPLHFHNLGDNLEHFEYIIDIDDPHDFLVDHADDSLIDL